MRKNLLKLVSRIPKPSFQEQKLENINDRKSNLKQLQGKITAILWKTRMLRLICANNKQNASNITKK
jgi:hypothetical protein